MNYLKHKKRLFRPYKKRKNRINRHIKKEFTEFTESIKKEKTNLTNAIKNGINGDHEKQINYKSTLNRVNTCFTE